MILYILIFYVSNSIDDYLVVHHWDCTGPVVQTTDYAMMEIRSDYSLIEQRILRVQVCIDLKQSDDNRS